MEPAQLSGAQPQPPAATISRNDERVMLGKPLWDDISDLIPRPTHDGKLRSVGERAFVAVFPAFLLLDWQICDVRVLLAAHHVVCLAGHACAVLLSAGFP